MKLNRIHRLIIIVLLLGLIPGSPSFAQEIRISPGKTPVPVKNSQSELFLSRAQRAEERGQYERALSTWRELLKIDPWSAHAVRGVSRSLIALKRYDEAEEFLQGLIRVSNFRTDGPVRLEDPTSKFNLTLELGRIQLERGNEEAAWVIWNGALSDFGRNDITIRQLVSLLQQHRLWEDSENLIREFRRSSDSPSYMALELANSLRWQMNFAAATEELLLFARHAPASWRTSLNYLQRFPTDSLAEKKVSEVLERAVRKYRQDVNLWQIYAGYFMNVGRLEEALDATIIADSLTNGGGTLVLKAGRSLLEEGEAELAERAFRQVLKWQPPADVTEQAELGLAECYTILGDWDSAQLAYAAFVEEHPKSTRVEEAKFKAADILLTHDRNPEEALLMFRGIWIRGRGVPRARVGLKIGDCLAQMENFGEAIDAWNEVVNLNPKKLDEHSAEALLRIARANMWRDSMTAASGALEAVLSGNPTNTAFNDAVQLDALITEGGFYRAQREWAEGDFALFRGEYEAAVQKFDTAAALLKRGKLAEWCRFMEAISLRSLGKSEEAIAVLDTFIVHYPGSVDLDRAMYTRALILADDLGDDAAALEYLDAFLVEHPRSIYLEQARRKARILSNRVL